MTRRLAAAALALLLTAASAGAGERFAWWLEPSVQQQLQLTERQVNRLERLFHDSLPERRRLRADAERCEQQLADALAAGDEDRVLALIDEAASAQRAHGRERALLVWRMYRVLTRQQRELLTRIAQASGDGDQAVFETSSSGVSTPR